MFYSSVSFSYARRLVVELSIIGALLFLSHNNNNQHHQQQQQQQQQQNSASIQAHQSDDDEAAASSLHSAVLHQKYFANIESFVDIGVPKLVNKLTSLCQDAFDE